MDQVEIIDGYCTPGTERELQIHADDLQAALRGAGVSRAVIAPQDREICVDNVTGNDRILSLAARYDGWFIPACTINPWYGDAGIRELRRAVARGSRMLVLSPALQGFILSDEVTDPLIAAAGELRIAVYVHTGPHSSAAPTQLALVAARHPDVQFIMGHCGSTDYAHDMPAVLALGLNNLWYEISLVRPWAVARYGQLMGDDRLIFASSAPRNDPATELNLLNIHWPIREHPGTYANNLRRLLAGGAA
ncbi:MAG: amidohydrolase family protein [Phycisphaeraceae bacterium]|nr:amidohydrolase family protein [Phycisphaeraceae bacterium]